MTQHLLVIAGKKAYRYDGSKRIEEADLDVTSEDLTIQEFKSNLEYFRLNGLPPPIIQPADVAFDRLARELATKRPVEGMSEEELKHLWDLVTPDDDDQAFVNGHYRIEDVREELTRRGLGSYCAV